MTSPRDLSGRDVDAPGRAITDGGPATHERVEDDENSARATWRLPVSPGQANKIEQLIARGYDFPRIAERLNIRVEYVDQVWRLMCKRAAEL